jgi:hypothetical protein
MPLTEDVHQREPVLMERQQQEDYEMQTTHSKTADICTHFATIEDDIQWNSFIDQQPSRNALGEWMSYPK